LKRVGRPLCKESVGRRDGKNRERLLITLKTFLMLVAATLQDSLAGL
jgi:hypothetical protein